MTKSLITNWDNTVNLPWISSENCLLTRLLRYYYSGYCNIDLSAEQAREDSKFGKLHAHLPCLAISMLIKVTNQKSWWWDMFYTKNRPFAGSFNTPLQQPCMENSPKTTLVVIHIYKYYLSALLRLSWHFLIVAQVIKDQNIGGEWLLGQLS